MSTTGSPSIPAKRGYDGPYIEQPCGCLVESWQDATGPQARIHACQMHRSAPVLIAALRDSLRWIAKVAADHDDDPVLHGQALRVHDRASAVIRKATEG